MYDLSTRATPFLMLCLLLPLSAASSCPGTSHPHKNKAWLQNDKDSVALYQFGEEGDLLVALEAYTTSPLFDGMKIEIAAKCDVNAKEKLLPDGSYNLPCKDFRITRATKGTAALFNLVEAIGLMLGAERSSSESGDFTLRFKKQGENLILIDKKKKDNTLKKHTLTPVPASRVKPWLTRFRNDTVEINPIEPKRRKRDLP